MTVNTSQWMNQKRLSQSIISTIPRPRGKIDQPILSGQGQHTLASGLEASETALVYKCGLIMRGMRVSGKTTGHMARENSFMLTGIYMKARGSMIKQMGLVYIFMSMELDTRVIGKMIYNMDKARRHGQMGQYMKGNTSRVRNMALVYTAGMMVRGMKVNGMKIRLEGWVPTPG